MPPRRQGARSRRLAALNPRARQFLTTVACLVLTTPRQTYASQPPIGIRSFLQPRGGQRGAPTTSTRHFSRKRDAEQWLASQEVAIAHGERVDPAVSKM